MRGGAQAHLIEADDGRFYVVKFRNNPQHHRILINESVASTFLQYLQIAAPEAAIISVSAGFLEDHPGAAMQLGNRTIRPEPGWHFGSLYPGDPDCVAVYDFIPDALLSEVVNLRQFLAMLVFDKWVGNADGRQAVFFRRRVKEWSPRQVSTRLGFLAWMIDQGFAFNGPYWDFPDSPLHGLYHRPLVYERVRSLDDFQPWLDQVVHFPEEEMDRAFRQVPRQWIAGEEDALESLLATLMRRRRRVPDLIDDGRRARPALFPNWA
jgi:hypothetical protein